MSDPQINFTVTKVSRPEGSGGSTAFDFTVTRTGPLDAASSVNWSYAGDDPVAAATASDLAPGSATSGTLSFAPGETSKILTINVAADSASELSEYFHLDLSGPSGATLGPQTRAFGTIINDDAAPDTGVTLSAVNREDQVLIGGAGADTLNAGQYADQLTGGGGADRFVFDYLPFRAGHVTDFTVGADKLDLNTLIYRYKYAGSDPIADGWVTLQSDGQGGTKVFFDSDGPDKAPQYPTLITTLDHLSPTGLTWAQIAVPTDTRISLNGGTSALNEGNSGITAINVSVVRTGPADGTSTVDFALTPTGNHPLDPSDFQGGALPSGTITFQPGETSKTITLNVVGDTTPEFDEAGYVVLSNATGGTIYSSSSYIAVYNDDSPTPTTKIAFETGTISHPEGDSGETDFVFTLLRTGSLEDTSFARWSFGGILPNPAGPEDFSGAHLPSGGSATFAPGESSKTIVVRVTGDTTYEPDEKFYVSLDYTSNADQGLNIAYGVILNDDAAPPPYSGPGVVITAPEAYGYTATGSSGDDTLVASHTDNTLIGEAGADAFVFKFIPTAAGKVTDFTVGTDRIDLSALLQASGYSGANPVADGYVFLVSDGAGGTEVLYDTDGPGSGDTVRHQITDLRNVSPTGLTWSQVSGGPSTGPGAGQVLTGRDVEGDTLQGGAGNDTLNASHSDNILTGGAGSDAFVFQYLPWNAGRVTDFTVGTDRLDLSALFRASGYSGSDPIADGYVSLVSDGRGGTEVLYDTDGRASGNTLQYRITDLENVALPGLTWAQLSGGAAAGSGTGGGAGGGSTGGETGGTSGQVLTASDQANQTLTGGSGDDTLTAGHNNDTLVGAGGGDAFVYKYLPWNAGHVSDFTVGSDRLDLSALLQATGYVGSDPVADGYVTLTSDNFGGTLVLFDTDGRAGGNTIQYRITDLDHVAPAGLTWSRLAVSGSGSGSGPAPGPGDGGSSGQVLTANDQPQQVLTGGAGDDTLNAGHNAVVETGAAGADTFAFDAIPWNAGHITDFTVGVDRLDLSRLFSASGYTGSDPIADGYVSLQSDGAGGASVFYDTDGRAAGNTIQFKITSLDRVSPVGLTWAQLTGSGAPPPPPAASVASFATSMVSHAEGNSGVTPFDFVVTRTNPEEALRLFWSASGLGTRDSVQSTEDWTDGSVPTGYLDFAAGQSSATITLHIVGDTKVEADERFAVYLGRPGESASARAVGIIQNDDVAGPGQVLTSRQAGDTLVGGPNNDTLNASQGPDTLTGGDGADHFVWANLPWNPGHVTDFTLGVDVLDLRQLFAQVGYTGSDPVADGYLSFDSAQNGTAVRFDPDGKGAGVTVATTITNLDHVPPSFLTSGDFLFN